MQNIIEKDNKYKTGVIDDPLGRPTVSPVANIVFAFVLLGYEKWRRMDGRTDDMCKNYDPYRPWLWVGRVDQLWLRWIEGKH